MPRSFVEPRRADLTLAEARDLAPLPGIARGPIQREMLELLLLREPATGFSPSSWDRSANDETDSSRGWRAWLGMYPRLTTHLVGGGWTTDLARVDGAWRVVIRALDVETLVRDVRAVPTLRIRLEILNTVVHEVLGRDMRGTEATAFIRLARNLDVAPAEDILRHAATVASGAP